MTKSSSLNSQKKSRRHKSPQDIMVDDFLKNTLKPHKKMVVIAYLLDLVSVFVLIGLALCLANLFAGLLNLQPERGFYGINPLIDHAMPVIVGCLIVRLILMSVREHLLSKIGNQMAMTVRQQALQAVGRLGLARRQFGADGALASHIVREPDELLGYARFSVQKMTAVSVPMIIGVAAAFFSIRSALILLATVPFVVFLMAMIGINTAKKSREQMDALAQMGGRFLDWLRGINTLTRLKVVGIASGDIEESANHYKKATMSVLKIAFLNSTVLEFFSAICIALVAVYLGFGLMGLLPWSKGVTIIDYYSALFILLLVPEFYLPLRRLGAEYHAKSSAVACAKVLAPIIATLSYPISNNQSVIKKGDIVLDRVSVTTDNRIRLTPLTLTIKDGQKWAIMGASGSGKSTLFEVILGVADYDGSAKIDGTEIKHGDLCVVNIGYLPQTPALLPISIAENLRLANSDATDDEIVEILTKVGLSEILQLPEGINTVLSERGSGLSGGQGQRLAIAQLLLQDADIWLLDEPTEHLDEGTKDDIHALLHQFSEQKTVLWATHDAPVDWLDGTYVIDVK